MGLSLLLACWILLCVYLTAGFMDSHKLHKARAQLGQLGEKCPTCGSYKLVEFAPSNNGTIGLLRCGLCEEWISRESVGRLIPLLESPRKPWILASCNCANCQMSRIPCLRVL